MKGIKYRVTYCEGWMEKSHGMSYQTDIIHIPELKVEINYDNIRKENDDYTKEINDVIPTVLGEVDIEDGDVEKIKTILNTSIIKKELIKKYIEEDKDDY